MEKRTRVEIAEDRQSAIMLIGFDSPECSIDPDEPTDEPSEPVTEDPTDPADPTDEPSEPVTDEPTISTPLVTPSQTPSTPSAEPSEDPTSDEDLAYTGTNVAGLTGMAVASLGIGAASLIYRRRKVA